MKLGLDNVVIEALTELSAADAAYKATFRLDESPQNETARRSAYDRRDAANERILNLAKALFPPPIPKCKPVPSKHKAASGSIVRAALPPPRVEVTILEDKPASRQTTLRALEGGGS